MKKLYFILVINLLIISSMIAQSPEAFKYQAIARSSTREPLVNQKISVRVQIIKGSIFGPSVYVETHQATTNEYGLLNLSIGAGKSELGTFDAIEWGKDQYYIEIAIDAKNGTNYVQMGIAPLLSVPYALYAKTAEKVTGGITETDPVFNTSLAKTISAIDTARWNNKLDYEKDSSTTNELQLISISNDTIYLSNGGFAKLPADLGFTGDYNDLLNKPLNIDEDKTNDVNITGNQTIAGNKTFTGSTTVAAPVNATDAATKAYVDALLARIEVLEVLNSGFTDSRDSNHYKVVKIGTQIWMAENLKYLPSVVGIGRGSQTTQYFYVYGYYGTIVADAEKTANYTNYGVLYNWPAAMAGSAGSVISMRGVKGVCPTGWHLPSDAEWITLTNYLGGTSVAGGKLKETGTTHWASPNSGATNETGFKGLPGGCNPIIRPFENIGSSGYWWSASLFDTSNALCRYLHYNTSSIVRSPTNKNCGFSVRCLRD